MTETVAPPGFARDPDPTRVVSVTSGTPDVVIGSSSGGNPSQEDDCGPDPNPAVDGDLTSDFCNPPSQIPRTITWEKRRHSNGVLVGGATFTIGGDHRPVRLLERSRRIRSRSRTTARSTTTATRRDRRRERLLRHLHGYRDHRATRPHARPRQHAPRQRDRRQRHDRHAGLARRSAPRLPPSAT